MKGRVFFGRKVEPDIRRLYEMKEVIYDKEWLEKADNVPLYYMYRDLYKKEDRKQILKNDLRYDVTVMPPRMLGEEYVKTKGHYHPKLDGLTYPEIYEVIEGKAEYLLQKKENGKITKALIIKAEAGDHVVIPPNFGHVTVNPSSTKTLEMANWVNRTFDSVYEPVLEKGGGCYFKLKAGFKENENYEDLPELETYQASEQDIFKGEMYELIKKPRRLEFLNDPKESFFKRFDYY